MEIKKLLGERIQQLRNNKKLTQEMLSEKISIERKSLSNIERGVNYPSAENLNKIMEILEVTPFDLFNYEYLKPQRELIEEMTAAMKNDEKLTQLMYKIFKAVK